MVCSSPSRSPRRFSLSSPARSAGVIAAPETSSPVGRATARGSCDMVAPK